MAKSTTLQAAVRDVLRPPFCTSFKSVTTHARNDNKEPGKQNVLFDRAENDLPDGGVPLDRPILRN